MCIAVVMQECLFLFVSYVYALKIKLTNTKLYRHSEYSRSTTEIYTCRVIRHTYRFLFCFAVWRAGSQGTSDSVADQLHLMERLVAMTLEESGLDELEPW